MFNPALANDKYTIEHKYLYQNPLVSTSSVTPLHLPPHQRALSTVSLPTPSLPPTTQNLPPAPTIGRTRPSTPPLPNTSQEIINLSPSIPPARYPVAKKPPVFNSVLEQAVSTALPPENFEDILAPNVINKITNYMSPAEGMTALMTGDVFRRNVTNLTFIHPDSFTRSTTPTNEFTKIKQVLTAITNDQIETFTIRNIQLTPVQFNDILSLLYIKGQNLQELVLDNFTVESQDGYLSSIHQLFTNIANGELPLRKFDFCNNHSLSGYLVRGNQPPFPAINPASLLTISPLKSIRIASNALLDQFLPLCTSLISSLPNLEELSFSHNGLSGPLLTPKIVLLCNAIGNLPRLRSLDLSNTSFTNSYEHSGVLSLADTLKKLPHLEMLNLSTSMVGTPKINPQLIENFSMALSTLHSLQVLNLSSNDLDHGTNNIKFVANALGSLSKLRDLNLSNNSIFGSSTIHPNLGIKELANSLERLGSLQRLNLSDNNIDNSGFIATAIGKLTNLRELNLSNNNIYKFSAPSFATEISKLHNLRVLEIANNNMSLADFSKIISSTAYLEKLNFNNNNIGRSFFEGPSAYAESFNTLAATLQPLMLQELYLKSNNISTDMAAALLNKLAGSPSLRVLDLSLNYIGHGFMPSSSSLDIPICPNLEVLDLSRNPLSAAGAAYLSTYISRLPRLQVLNLSQNNLIPQGNEENYKFLFENIARIPTLKELHLSYTDLGSTTALVAPYIGSLRNLQVLNLSYDNLGPNNTVIIAPFLSQLQSLKILNLAGNNMQLAGARALMPVIGKLPTLEQINLTHNNIISAGGLILFGSGPATGAFSTDPGSQLLVTLRQQFPNIDVLY